MATLYVGSDQTYTTIKAALDAAADGDIIIVSAGDYTAEKEIQINKSVTLKAAEGAAVVVDHIVLGASYNQPWVDSVTISGLTMKPTAFNGGDWNYTGVWQNNQNIGSVTVEKCIVDFTNAPTNNASVGFKFNRGIEGATTDYSITGCTVIANSNTQYGVTIGTQGAVEDVDISGNNFTGAFTSAAVHMDMGFKTTGEYAIAIEDNNIENTNGRGIYFGGINNEDAAIEITGNTIVANSSKCAVGFHSTSVKAGELDITGNNISGAQIGIDMTYVANPGDVIISDNTITVIEVTSANGSYAPTGIVGYTPAAGANTVTGEVEVVADGDIVVAAGYADGVKFYNNGKIYQVGVNAFGSFVDALKNVTADTSKIAVSGNVTEDIPAESMSVVLSKNLEISGAGSVVTLNNGGYQKLIFESAASDVTVSFTGVQLVAPKTQVFFGNAVDGEDGAEVLTPVKAVVSADSVVSAYIVKIETGSTVDVLEGGKFFSTGEVMNISGTLNAAGNAAFDPAAETLTADDRQIVAHYMWNYGNVTLADNYSTVYSQLRLIGSDAVMTLNNARLDVGVTVAGAWLGNPASNGVGWVRIGGGSEMTLTNNSVMKASGANVPGGYGLTVDADGAFTVASGSSAEFGAGVLNNGAINVNGGSLTVGSKFVAFQTGQPAFDFVNNGTFTVSGTSTLDIATVTGNSVRLADGAVIKDSTIGGTVVADGNVTFEGANTVATLNLGYYNHTVTIGAGSSLAVIGSTPRTTLSYGNTLDVDGSIVDAKAAVADKANMTASLNIAAGFSFTGNANYNGKNAVLDVDNAYVSFGGSTSKNSAATGDFVFNFDNSIVDFTAEFKVVASTVAGLNPTFKLNVADSVFTVTKNFVLGHVNTTAVFDNSIINANACFKNSGLTTLVDGTVMTVKSNGDGPGRENTGNFGTLSVTTGSVFDITSGTVAVADAFYNVGTVEVKTNGTFKTTYFNNLSSIVIDGTASFIAKEILGEGTITIDAANFDGGFKKVIDLSSTASMEGKVTLTNADGASLLYGADGDVYLAASISDTILVDTTLAGKTLGEEVAGGKVFGYDAFADINSAAAVAENNPAATLVIAEGSDVNYDRNQWYFLNTKDEEFEAGKWSYDYAVDASKVYDVVVNGKFTAYQHLLNNATVTVNKTGLLRNSECTRVMGGTLILNGNREAGAAALTKDEIFRNVNGNPTTFGDRLYATDAIQLQTAVMQVSCGGTISIKNSSVFSGTSGNVWAIIGFNGGGTLSLNNSHIYLCSTGGYGPSISMTNTADGVFALKDSSVLVIQEGVANTINNAGTMTMTGNVVVDAKIVNTGSAVISGDSSVTIKELDGTVEVADGTLTDANIYGGAAAFTGDVTLAGDNKISKIWVTGGTTTVAEGATLVTTSPYAGFAVIGGNENINANEQGFYKGFDSNEAGKFVVNGTYNAEEFAVSNGGELVVNGTMTANCAYLRAGSTVVNGSLTGIVWGGVDAGASITINGGTFETRKADGMGSWGIYGDFNVTADSNVKIAELVGNGTITIDAAGFSGNRKVVDVDSSSFSGTINAENLASGMRYEVAADGDIWLLNDTILVDAAFGLDGAVIPEGYVLGLNAFASLDTLSAAASQGARTIVYTARETGALEIDIKSVSGRTDYQIGGYNRYVSSGKTETETLKVVADQTYTFVFTNDQADFDLTYRATAANVAKDLGAIVDNAVGADISSSSTVSAAVGKQELNFELTDIADLSFTLSVSNYGKVEYTLLDAAGNTILRGYSSSAITRTAEELAAGNYKLVVESLDGKNANFNVSGEVDYKVTGPTDAAMVSLGDNTIATAFDLGTSTEISGWVGNVGTNVDGIDFIDVTDAIKNGRNYFSITATGNAKATIWALSTRGEWVEQMNWNITDETDTRSLVCAAGTQYYVSIESNNDSNYTMQLR